MSINYFTKSSSNSQNHLQRHYVTLLLYTHCYWPLNTFVMHTTHTEVWCCVLSELQEQRAKLDLPYLSYPPSHVYRQFGLDHPLIVQLLEQLPGASRCTEYKFQYHKPPHSQHWRVLVSRCTIQYVS